MNTRRLWFSFALLLLAPALAGLAAEKDLYGDPLPKGAKARIGTARLRLSGYSGTILAPDGKSLYAQTNAGLVRLDPATGAVQQKVPGQLYGAPTIIAGDGKRAAHVMYDRVVVWDTTSGKTLAKIERRLPGNENGAVLSNDGKVLAIGGIGDRAKKEAVSVLVWNVDTDKELKKITVPQNDYANVALSGDGKTLATWGSYYDPDAKTPPNPETNPTRFVTFWDATSGKELSKFRAAGYVPLAVAFTANGSIAAVSSGTSSIDLVDPKTGTSTHLLLGRSRMGRMLAFSPDGGTVGATSDEGTVQRWKVADGTRLSTTEAPIPNAYTTRVRLLDNEKGLAWASRGVAVIVWEVPSGKLISPEGGHTSAVRGVAVTPDNKHVVTSSEDGTTMKWELATGKPVGEVKFRSSNTFGGYLPTALFAADMKHVLIRDSNGIALYDMESGSQQYVIPTPIDGYSYGTFSGDGSKVVVSSASFDTKRIPGRVSVWNIATSKRIVSLELPGYNSLSAAITPDGKHVITAGRKASEKGDGEFIITTWDAATGEKKGEHSEESGFTTPHVVAASDNKTAAVVTSAGKLVAYDLTAGKVGKTYNTGQRTPGLAPLFSPDGKSLAVVCQAGFGVKQESPILVLDWPSGDVKYQFNSHGSTPIGVVFSPDGKSLVTGSPDTTATVWDLSK